jgi:hypothetical protein
LKQKGRKEKKRKERKEIEKNTINIDLRKNIDQFTM